ncbi:alpha/beta hydrolase family protein [Synoicihabitans lomoniglobus]|uniref:Prolyl oligopeptidase family serine peptidase n=1 Tax=Synoicihabitans lomoniglobus TaxID=2909285 RepID=A0AAF0CP93_9BACT|nr:prolyl oligopeptidase family serine peptidase [Opitutaceae bacterium LMO-M01]WED65675.1 prolyl oligopeptidase family serine peptidase [Opitutaceae bacterium LMO-M01]
MAYLDSLFRVSRPWRTRALFVIGCCLNLSSSTHAGQQYGVTQSEWHGYERLDFVVAGQPAILIVPHESAPSRPWVWRAEWFGDRHGPQVSLALLAEGWHLAYINASDRYGSPEAMRIFDAFYDHLITACTLDPRVVIEGFSRGGLYAVNFAANHPDRVAALYLDAPALDLRSWPGYDTPRWPAVVAHYGLTLEAADTAKFSPIHRLQPLLDADIPIIGVAGDADPVVPYDENLAVLKSIYEAGGGTIKVILKPGVGHHPHSLADPTPIVDFIRDHTTDLESRLPK